MMQQKNHDSLLSDINVTPFVDVMLVLLIIFMVAAPMMVQGIDVSLPETRTVQQLDTEQEPLVVVVDKEGEVHINDMAVGLENLGEKLEKIFENRSSPEVFLRADQNVAYGRVVLVMSEIKSAGVQRLGVVAQQSDDAQKTDQD
ncbi:MAG: ExbD/TolR family protein [Desulfobacterales bacterium]|nr:ExbD/TolR family protein [Desulfobacterales bacterium]